MSQSVIPDTNRVEVFKGDISDRESFDRAMNGVTHVVHLATCKETPENVMDVTVKGMFWLLESSAKAKQRQFILIGGDASIGHFFYRHDGPITETRTKLIPAAMRSQKFLKRFCSPNPHSIWHQRLLPPRAMDHGEGRLPLFTVLRR